MHGGDVEIVEVKTGEVVKSLNVSAHEGEYARIEFSPEGKRILTCSSNYLAIWDTTNWSKVWSITSDNPVYIRYPYEIPYTARFTPDGKWLIGDSGYRIWDATTGTVRDSFKFWAYFDEKMKQRNAPLIPQRIFAACRTESLHEFGTLIDVLRVIPSVAKNGAYLFTAIDGADEKQVWDVASGRRVTVIKNAQKVDDWHRAHFSVDGNQICLFVDSDKSIHVWESRSGREIARLGARASSDCGVCMEYRFGDSAVESQSFVVEPAGNSGQPRTA